MSATTELSGLFFQWHLRHGLMRVPFFGIVTNIGPRLGFRVDPRFCMADILCFEETKTGLHFDMRYQIQGASIIHFETEPPTDKPYLIGRYSIEKSGRCGEFHMLPPSPSSVSIEEWKQTLETTLPKLGPDIAKSQREAMRYWTDFSGRFQLLPRDFLQLSRSPHICDDTPPLLFTVPQITEQAPIVIKACEEIFASTREALPEVWTRLFLRIRKIAKEKGVFISDVLEQAMKSGTQGLSFLGALEILEAPYSEPKIYITPKDYENP